MSSEVSFQLPENLTIASVQGLHEQLETLVDQHDHDKIIIQASAVKRADTAGLQLLLAFVNTTKDRQIKLDWNTPSEKLLAAAELLGLEGDLGIH